jgi:hypothetical protein
LDPIIVELVCSLELDAGDHECAILTFCVTFMGFPIPILVLDARRSIKVWFEQEDAWYHGTVISTVPDKSMNLGDTGALLGYAEVEYTDKSTDCHLLNGEDWEWEREAPATSTSDEDEETEEPSEDDVAESVASRNRPCSCRKKKCSTCHSCLFKCCTCATMSQRRSQAPRMKTGHTEATLLAAIPTPTSARARRGFVVPQKVKQKAPPVVGE